MIITILIMSYNFLYAMPSKDFNKTVKIDTPNCSTRLALGPSEAGLVQHTKEGINLRRYDEFLCGMESTTLNKNSLKWIVVIILSALIFSTFIAIIYNIEYKKRLDKNNNC